MKPTCPLSRRLNPPQAALNQAKGDPATTETDLPTNSSAGETIKSVGTGAEIGFSQSEALHNPSEFGKLNPEAPAAGTTTGEQPTNLGASKRRVVVNHYVQQLTRNCSEMDGSALRKQMFSNFELALLKEHRLPKISVKEFKSPRNQEIIDRMAKRVGKTI